MDTRQQFEEAYSTLEKNEVVVMRDVKGFPVNEQDIISPYLMIFICHSGTARALYDMKEIVFQPNEVALVLPNHIIRSIECSADYRVTIIVHSRAFEQEMTRHRMTHDRNKFHTIPACQLTDEELKQYLKAVDVLEHISLSSVTRYPNRHEMLMAQTDIMVEILDACRREIDAQQANVNRKYLVFTEFCNLLAMHYREQHEVAFYAEKAHLTTRHFSVLIQQTIGQSASDYIEQYLTTQAKNLLSTRPDLSVQQISYHLGFAESSSFCRFFKRHTGVSPTNFRQLNTRSSD